MQLFAHFSRICAFKRGHMGKNIAIFASGSGSNAENIICHFKNNPAIKVVLVVSDQPQAYVLERCKVLEVDSVVFPKEKWANPYLIISQLKEYQVDFIVLAGFLRRIPKELIETYPHRIINIHPALLPKFGGKGMYGLHVHQAVLEACEPQTGITIHYINEHYDEGAPVFQATCPVIQGDTPETLAQRVHQLEHDHFPQVIERLINQSL